MPSSGSTPRGLVEPALPVERDLQRVLDGQCAAVDEEQVRQCGVAEHARESVDEACHRDAVHIGVARLVHRGLRQLGAERLVVGQRGMVHAQRRGREEGEHVEVALAGAGVDQDRAGRALDVEHEVQAVGEDAAAQHLAHVGGADRVDGGCLLGRGHHGGHKTILATFLRSNYHLTGTITVCGRVLS